MITSLTRVDFFGDADADPSDTCRCCQRDTTRLRDCCYFVLLLNVPCLTLHILCHAGCDGCRTWKHNTLKMQVDFLRALAPRDAPVARSRDAPFACHGSRCGYWPLHRVSVETLFRNSLLALFITLVNFYFTTYLLYNCIKPSKLKNLH